MVNAKSYMWFSRAQNSVYHIEAPDWRATGRAVCGRDISRPAWCQNAAIGTVPQKQCKACVKKVSK